MKKVITLLVGLMLMFSFTACSGDNGNADKGNDGMIENAGDAANDVLDGTENAIDEVTGSDNGNNNTGSNNNNNSDTANN